MYKRILVPLDGSEASSLGLKEAIKLAVDQEATVRLVRVVNEFIVASATAVNLRVILNRLRRDGESLLGKAVSAVRGAGIEADTVLAEASGGQAGPLIVQQANEWRADLIVCGTHGRRGVRRIVMGSDAEHVVRHTPVPVLLVRNPEARNQ